MSIDSKYVAHNLDAQLELRDETVLVQALKAGWAGGRIHIDQATVQPFATGLPLEVKGVHIRDFALPELMDDLAGHPHAHVGLLLSDAQIKEFSGTLDPLSLEGILAADTRDFGIYDKPTIAKNKSAFMELSAGALSGVLAITPNSIEFRNTTLVTRRSRVNASVAIGFDETLGIQVRAGSVVDFADITPLVGIHIAGRATLSANGGGTFGDPQIQGKLKVANFEFGGFRIGDVEQADVRFEPLRIDLTNAVVRHGNSAIDVPRFAVDFEDGDAAVVVKADVDTRRAGLRLTDFFSMVGRDEDPRFASLKAVGRGQAKVYYVLGGGRDTCGGGKLLVRSHMHLSRVNLFDEPYDGGEVDFRLLWDDFDAGDRGMEVDVYSAVLSKGGGEVVASATVRHGAVLHADVVGNGVSLLSLNALREQFANSDDTTRVLPEAEGSFVAVIGGTLTRLEGSADIHLSPMRLGPDVMPASDIRLDIVPTSKPQPRLPPGARCPGGTSKPFDLARYRRDLSDGWYRISGGLFGNQIRSDGLEVSQQRSKRVRGRINLDKLDIGKMANLVPGIAFSAKPPRGDVSAVIDLKDMAVDKPSAANARITLKGLDVRRGVQRFSMGEVNIPLVIADDTISLPNLPMTVELGEGLRTTVSLNGLVTNISAPSPQLDLRLILAPVQLSELGLELPRVQRATGFLAADVTIRGTSSLPQ
ncbi:MAG TPA: hypothetical protein ENK23_09135, partial [Sorangium sp.]|nr:hypothetical protein [Sorangium sp.]